MVHQQSHDEYTHMRPHQIVGIEDLPHETGVYLIWNVINRKVYIGKAVDLRVRVLSHQAALRRGCHGNAHLQNAWNLNQGRGFQVEMLCILDDIDRYALVDMEQLYIRQFSATDKIYGYNILETTSGGILCHSTETKLKMSLAKRGKPSPKRGVSLRGAKGQDLCYPYRPSPIY